jgi:hypothetical protein
MQAVFYVDGFNLYHGLRSKYGRRYLWLDLQSLAAKLRADSEVLAIHYFTAIVKGDPEAARRQETYLGALTRHCPAVIVHRGHFKAKTPAPCRKCGQSWTCRCQPPIRYRTFEEKLTDVALASRLLEDTATGFGDLSVIVSTDSDFVPAIDAATRIAPSRPILIACPPGRVSPRLLNPAVTAFPISEAFIKDSQLPECIEGPHAKHPGFNRPSHWSIQLADRADSGD